MANDPAIVPTLSSLDSSRLRFGLLERYRPLTRLGRGGMAEVFLATWEVAPNVQRPVVIKRLHAHLSDDPVALQMFLDEARLACRLEHENVVRTLEAGVIDDSCCIVMEYLEGQPLNRVIRRAYEVGKLPLEVAVAIAIAVLDALAYAHTLKDYDGAPLGIVHRDVSPHNVFVTNDGVVKVLDFGIAKAKTHEGHTATGLIKGKIGYIAPEQALASGVDLRADIFSTGVLLWEAVSGHRLFKGETEAGTLNLTLRGEMPAASVWRPELPRELDVILKKALERDPKLRYATASAMRDDLCELLRSLGLTANARSLGLFMQSSFAEEIGEQRRLVTTFLSRPESIPPSSSYRKTRSTSAMILASELGGAQPSASVGRAVSEFRAGSRLLLRIALVMLGVLLGVGAVLLRRSGEGFREEFSDPTSAPLPVVASTAIASPLDHPSEAHPTQAARVASDLEPVAAGERVDVAATRNPDGAATAPRAQRADGAATAPRAQRADGAGKAPSTRSAPNAHRAEREAAGGRESNADGDGVGYLSIDSTPWSVVSADGRVLGQTPLVRVKLSAGVHTLSLRNPELGGDTAYAVTIESGKVTTRRIGLTK